MRVTDSQTREIFVERDPDRAGLELQIGDINTVDARFVRLTLEEARRLAALLLFQAARLDRPAARWRLSPVAMGRRSA
jgi:hypothetical protein